MARKKVHATFMRSGRARSIPARIRVQRVPNTSGAGAFEACVHLARGVRIERTMRGAHSAGGCAQARNPRLAISKALHRFASGMARRHGAFHGR